MNAAIAIALIVVVLAALILLAYRLGQSQLARREAEAEDEHKTEVLHAVQTIDMHAADASADELRATLHEQRVRLGEADPADRQ